MTSVLEVRVVVADTLTFSLRTKVNFSSGNFIAIVQASAQVYTPSISLVVFPM